MPTYTYRCNDCGHEFDIRQRMADDPLTECPICQGNLRRVVGSVGIVFKGKGFYVTDNRTNGASSRGKTSGEKSGADAADAHKSKDKKPKDKSSSDTGKSD